MAHSPSPGVTSAPRPCGALVLLADRDPQLRILAEAFLVGAGHRVVFAADGVEALRMVAELRPAVLITEILLPKLDGLALCRKVKSDGKLAATRILVFSILAASLRARDAGADAFLAKPMAKDRFSSALASLLVKGL